MSKVMLNMEELESVAGGNIFTDAWDWLCDKFSRDEQPKTGVKPITKIRPYVKV